ncbi:MAG: hydrogenase maturation protease [Mariprofundales bacterium]|nr:hydrogenase maturation protease [Mariprofundales bacterium]
MAESATPATLLFGYGNPGRGDDGVGPELLEAMRQYLSVHDLMGDIECLTDMQLQIEHITDMVDRQRILFVDADLSCAEPCSLSIVLPAKDDSYTSHAMSPQALVYTYQQIYGVAPPDTYLLSIRAYQFELGGGLCADARHNLSVALTVTKEFCAR